MIVAFAFGIGVAGFSSRAAAPLKDQAAPESSSDESIATSYERLDVASPTKASRKRYIGAKVGVFLFFY